MERIDELGRKKITNSKMTLRESGTCFWLGDTLALNVDLPEVVRFYMIHADALSEGRTLV
jgi:hypothetical protein